MSLPAKREKAATLAPAADQVVIPATVAVFGENAVYRFFEFFTGIG